ncbi:hypothetical protein [Foetidibacter luteolus]|uniref:hypothetical protein n=1 Tax=Foetidibacter luteolus TaxID=2608880 RepID=UPI00129A85A5|nr:hypothetical protein [Foetidibacter luteolus]
MKTRELYIFNCAANTAMQTLAGILLDTLLLMNSQMIKLLFSFSFLFVVNISKGQTTVQKKSVNQTKDTLKRNYDFSRLKPVELPRPNSGTFTYEQAGKRKNEIYNLQLTPKHFSWTNPTSGGAVHINKRDEIEVYQFTIGILESVTDSAINYIDAPKDTFVVITDPKNLHYYVGGIGEGNPASVLITSEIRLDKSEAIKKIMQELWLPSVQIYYLTKRR